jgi:polysaccharide export outer membrane protein
MRVASIFRSLAIAVALAGASACTHSAPPMEETVALNQNADYRLGPGDQLRVTVFGQEQLSGEFPVDAGGNVSIPLVGAVPARGLTQRELETRISDTLAKGYVKQARVSVDVLNFRPFYIIGEVQKPGQYPFANGMTAINAVAMAGGYTYRAKEDYVLITRMIDGRKQERSAPINTPVLPDDVVRVPERLF